MTSLADLLLPLTNRGADGKFTLPADGWYHGLPKGEFPNAEELPDGTTRRALQVIDEAALTAMKNSFEAEAAKPNFAGLLVDFDHFSGDQDKSSEAAGWITAWQNRASGAWWQIRWSDSGEQGVLNGRYRFISGEFLPRDCQYIEGPIRNAKTRTLTMKVRPLRLASAGLTNKPNLKGLIPLSNREEPGGSPADKTNNKKTTMQRLAAFVGLSAEASEEAILAELTKLKNRADTAEQANSPLKNRVTELETQNVELLDDQIAADLDARGIKDQPKRDALIPVLKPMKNRQARLGFLDTVVEKKADETKGANGKSLTNRASAKTPADKAASTDDGEQLARDREKEVRDYRLKNRCSNAEAWDAVRRDRPELFGITAVN